MDHEPWDNEPQVPVNDSGLYRCQTCRKVRQIYARNLCSKCYYKCSRLKKASKCKHSGVRPHYSKGLCRECYLRFYYKKRKSMCSRNAGKQKDTSSGHNANEHSHESSQKNDA